MQVINYLFFKLSVGIFYLFPFRLIYVFSDFLAFLFYHIIQYRKKVIFANLNLAFPNKSKKEIRKIAKKSYLNLTDILLESLKGFTVNNETLKKRYRILNPQLLQNYYSKNRSLIGVSGHYGNWEWGALAGAIQIQHLPIAFYKPLSNKLIDNYIKRSRTENGTLLKSMFQTTQSFQDYKKENCIFLMVADQNPGDISKAHWVKFLGQKTACLHGPEKHAKLNDYPVVYIDIQRIKRGYYTVYFSILVEKPNEYQEGQITEAYMKKLESIIIKKPENWLWSHKRWKRRMINT
jgi:KDO2-lipid IV(A) lauroyltransferase